VYMRYPHFRLMPKKPNLFEAEQTWQPQHTRVWYSTTLHG
jgi:hypothetical protein